jgi:macrolide transport system ATP-binding/permease protein
VLLTARHLEKSYGAHTILRDCSLVLVLVRGERVGIVGANGAGKSTLLKLLAGIEEPNAGTITRAAALDMGYLPQSTPAFAGSTIADLIAESLGALRALEQRMRALESAMTTTQGEALDELLEEYGEAAARFQDRGGYEMEPRIDIVLAGLGLARLSQEREVATISGGERARVGLATLLLRQPDALLLDEPTNHLDIATLAWLEEYLAGYSGGVAIVSHDRQFLNRTVTHILEVDDTTHTLKRYTGDYDAYAATKRAERAQWEERYAQQQQEMSALRRRIREAARSVAAHNRPQRDNDKMQHRFFGERVADAVSRNARNAEERLARLQAEPVPKPPKPLYFQPRLQSEALRAKQIMRAEGLAKGYGGRTLFADLSFVLKPGARILLTGPNGAGKTTLLRILLGAEAPDGGSVRRAPSVRVGYLPQDPAEADAASTVLQTFRAGQVGDEAKIVASLLGNGLFRLEDTTRMLGQLSLGQRRKLEIARMVADGPNVLLLDEPTNYISLNILEAFERAVLAFPGPVIAISHDRWFIQRFGGEVWRLADGILTTYAPGTYDGTQRQVSGSQTASGPKRMRPARSSVR